MNDRYTTQDNQDGLMIYEKYRILCQKSVSTKTNSFRNVGKCELRADAPRDLLMPQKVEIYKQNPRIEVYHDVISDGLADMISELSHESLVSKLCEQIVFLRIILHV